MKDKCLVVLSGGQDSATCLALACEEYKEVHAITFYYMQKHTREITCAMVLGQLAGVASHQLIPVMSLAALQSSALLNPSWEIKETGHPMQSGLPTTFVPGRNLLFLTLAGAHAFSLGVTDIYIGVCQTDYSGYPDCRQDFVINAQTALRRAMEREFNILTPLMYLTKGETVEVMQGLEKLEWYRYTHTCYMGGEVPCGTCPACVLRAKGFAEAEIEDPLLAMHEDYFEEAQD